MDSEQPRREDRREDRGRGARRLDLKDWITLAGLMLAVGAIVWRGGQMTEQLETVAKEVTKISADVAVIKTETPVLKIRVDQHDKEITQHDNRLYRVEAMVGAKGN